MPEFPPVTMNTLPLRLGRLSGWKVMFEKSTSVDVQRYNAKKQIKQCLGLSYMLLMLGKNVSKPRYCYDLLYYSYRFMSEILAS